MKERSRIEILVKIKSGRLTRRSGAELLGVSYRQLKRIYSKFELGGSESLAHGLRSRPSNHVIEADRRSRIVELYASKYGDFGPTLATEFLLRDDGERVGIETLRRWLVSAGLWHSRRRGSGHRQWRERRAHWGELVQMDGSEHDWFEGRRGRASMMVMIDDATNWTHARFFESETTAAAMTVFAEYVGYYRMPRALYVDRDSIYETTRDSTVDESLRNATPLTQFGRAMKVLGVEVILAHSPQAKGRVERRHGVFQDRLVKGMRLKGISTLDAANQYLEEEFLDELNTRFHVEARSPEDVHQSVPRGIKLEYVLCYEEVRVVQNDWTVSWCNRILQLDACHRKLVLARKQIMVSELLDGALRLTYRGVALSWRELPSRPIPAAKKLTANSRSKVKYKPAATHPWRRRSPPV